MMLRKFAIFTCYDLILKKPCRLGQTKFILVYRFMISRMFQIKYILVLYTGLYLLS
jgi:hypothetical protein